MTPFHPLNRAEHGYQLVINILGLTDSRPTLLRPLEDVRLRFIILTPRSLKLLLRPRRPDLVRALPALPRDGRPRPHERAVDEHGLDIRGGRVEHNCTEGAVRAGELAGCANGNERKGGSKKGAVLTPVELQRETHLGEHVARKTMSTEY